MAYTDIVNWKTLGDLSYRSMPIYPSLLWDITDIGDYIVSVAPCGGAIATWFNTSTRLSTLQSSGTSAPDVLSIFSASGQLLSHTQLDIRTARLVTMGWTDTEQCVLMFDNGSVEVYELSGEQSARSFSLFPPSSKERIEEGIVSPRSAAALSRTSDGSYNVYVVQDWADPTPVRVEDTGLGPGVRPTALAVIDGSFTRDEKCEVLLGSPDRSLILIDSSLVAEDQDLGRILGAVPQAIVVSPGGKFVAVFGEDAVLTVIDTVFEHKILEFDTRATMQPSQLVWCAEDALLLSWPDKVLLIGPNGDSLVLDYDVPVYLISEMDGVRILTATSHDFLQLVPPALRNIRSIGSTSASAMLMVAAAKFEEGSADCDDMIRALISDELLKDAVTECISGALQEWEPTHQRQLLRAASYGKNFDGDYDSSIFVNACKSLRVLNAVRSFEAALPLTSQELDSLTASAVVNRLCSRHQYKLALSICDFLGIHKDRVMLHWACTKVKTATSESDETVRDKLKQNLSNVTSVSFADIAAAADSAGRRRLATMLLDFEPRASDQVPILLKMREGQLALQKALESGDTDLVYLALLHIRQQVALEVPRDGSRTNSETDEEADDKFLRMVLGYPAAVDLLAVYYRDRDVEPRLLVKLLTAAARYCDAGNVLIRAAYAQTDFESRLTTLREALEAFVLGERSGRASASEKAACAFFRASVEEELQLLNNQVDLEKDLDTDAFIDLSVNDTLFNAIVLGGNKKALQLKDAFKIPDAEFWHVKVRALAHARDWAGLQKFAEEKRSPIGYKAFVEACMEADAMIEAKKYAAKIQDYTEKVDMLIKLGAFTDAAEAAFKQRDLDKLNQIGELAVTPAAIDAVEKFIAQLTSKR